MEVGSEVNIQFSNRQAYGQQTVRSRDPLEKLMVPQLVRNFQHFMKLKSSLPSTQQPTTCR